jgi:hypothetical protein
MPHPVVSWLLGDEGKRIFGGARPSGKARLGPVEAGIVGVDSAALAKRAVSCKGVDLLWLFAPGASGVLDNECRFVFDEGTRESGTGSIGGGVGATIP